MTFGSLPLLWMLATTPAAPALAPLGYVQAPVPFASTTLLVKGAGGAIVVLDATNVGVDIVAAEYQELRRSRAFSIICTLPDGYDIGSIGAWADSRHHLIPITVVEYKTFNPHYMKLEIDTAYLTNEADPLDWDDHKVHIEFLSNRR